MATVENLIVQIFDRKRQIIDQLKQQKLLYDQHLASKFLIQGISPPSWLLPSNLPPSSSHFTALDKADLISGLLHPRPGPALSCCGGHGFLYDKPNLAVNDSVADEASAEKCLSSNGCDEDVSSVIPLFHVKDIKDGVGIVPSTHVEVSACALNYLPMSPEDQSYTRTCDAHSKQDQSLVRIHRSRSRQKALEIHNSAKTSDKSCSGITNHAGGLSQNKSGQGEEQANGPRESLEWVRPFSLSTEMCYKEEELLKVRSPDASGCSLTESVDNEVKEVHTGDNQKKEKSSSAYVGRDNRSSSQCQQPKDISSGSKTHGYFAQLDSSVALIISDEDFKLRTEIRSEKKEGITTCSTSDACSISLSRDLTVNNNGGDCAANSGFRGSVELYKPFSLPTEICSEKEEIRTCSTERSGDASNISVLRDLTTIDNDGGGPSASKCCQGDEQVNDLRESLDLVKSFSLPNELHYKKETNGLRESLELVMPFSPPIEHHYEKETSIKMRSPDPRVCLLTQSANNEAKEVHLVDNQETEKRDRIYSGRITRSSGFCQQSVGISSGSKRQGYSEQLDGMRDYLESHKAFELPTEVCSSEEAGIGTCLTEKSSDAHNIFLSRDLEINSDVGVPSGNNNSQDHEQPNDLRDSLELVKPSPLLTKTCNKEETSVEVTDAYFGFLLQSPHNEAKEVYAGDDWMKGRSSSVYGGRITRSKNNCQHTMAVSSEIETHGSFQQLPGSRENLESHKAFASPTKIFTLQELGIENCSTKSSGACNISLSKSADVEAKEVEVQKGYNRKKEKNSSVYVGRITRSSSRCQQFMDGPSRHGHPEQLDGSGESLGSYKSSVLPTEICSCKEAKVGPCLTKEGCDDSDLSLTKSADNNAKDGQARDDGEKEKSSSGTCAGRISTSGSGCQLSSGIPSSSKTSGFWELFNGTRECAESVKQTASPIGMISKEEAETGNGKSEMQHQEDSGRNGIITMTCELKQMPPSSLSNDRQNVNVKPSHCSSEQLEVKTDPDNYVLCGASKSDLVNRHDVVDRNFAGLSTDKNRAFDCSKSVQSGKRLKFSIGSPVIERMDVDEVDQAMPEFERFEPQNFGDVLVYKEIPNLMNIMEQTNLHEHTSRSAWQGNPMPHFPSGCKSSGLLDDVDLRSGQRELLCKSSCLSTPTSPFPAACKSYLEPGVYSSVPGGLLENFELRNNLLPASSALQRKSQSDLFSFPQNQRVLDIRKLFLSPVERGIESITSKSGGFEKVRSGNPELTCFTILEDPESSEENVNDAKSGLEATDSSSKCNSVRESLCDISVKNKKSLAPDHAIEKRSSESMTTEISISEICNVESRVNAMSHTRSKRTTQGKENTSFSVGANSFKKHSKALSSRFSKPKLSGQSSLRSRGQSMIDKEPKRNNIVSNVNSFIPLVQQKQAAAAAPVNRDVKVKALEAAEAAKRLAEKKENERKQKKEALKTERARLEQENLKQMELAKKLKEEAMKKRGLENAAKKRQREEDEKKEKERKRKRIEDARFQQKQAEEKIHAWREKERTLEGKEPNKNDRYKDRAFEASISSKLVNELVDEGSARTEAGDGIPTLNDHKITEPSDVQKVDSIVSAASSTPNFYKGGRPDSRTSEEDSYDISPYQCSDDEEEEDDEVPNKKHIPSWASKSSVLLALSSLQCLNPDTIFPCGSFCSLDEVLVPRRLPQDSRK